MGHSLDGEGETAGWDEFLEHTSDVSVSLIRYLSLSSQGLKDV